MRLPHVTQLEGREADVVISGVPFDLATTGRSGSRFQPQGIRKASVSRNVVGGTVVVPFIDPDAIERELKTGEIACVLPDPVMTDPGVVYPEDGIHEQFRELTT